MFLEYTIIFIILFGLTLPVNYLIIRNIIASFKLLKEIVSDNEEIIEKYQREQIEENLKKLKEKEEHGYLVYYVQRIKKWLKKNSFNLYVLFLFLGLVFLYLLYNEPTINFPVIKTPTLAGYIFLPVISLLTIGYFLAKSEKMKWVLQFMLIIYIGVKLLWDVIVLKNVVSIGLIAWLFVASFLFTVHYRKWKKENDEKMSMLQLELQQEYYSRNQVVKQYHELLERRHDNKKHFNMLYHLNQEKEIAAMQEYLAHLKKEEQQAYDLE